MKYIPEDLMFEVDERTIWGFGLDSGHWHHTWKYWKYKYATAQELAYFITQHTEHCEIYYTKTWSLSQWWNGNPDTYVVWVIVGRNENAAYFRLTSIWFEMFCDRYRDVS